MFREFRPTFEQAMFIQIVNARDRLKFKDVLTEINVHRVKEFGPAIVDAVIETSFKLFIAGVWTDERDLAYSDSTVMRLSKPQDRQVVLAHLRDRRNQAIIDAHVPKLTEGSQLQAV